MSATVIPFRQHRREVVVERMDDGFGPYWSVHCEHADGSWDRSVPGRISEYERDAWTLAGLASKAFGLPVRGVDGTRWRP